MSTYFSSDANLLRAEIAAAAARLIAEDGMDYGAAKRKAAKQILGNNKSRGDILPNNALIEEEVRQYQALFFADTQPVRLQHLRTLALQIMLQLAPFDPHLTGAVLNGTAGDHSDIRLHLFADSPKDVEIYLLNKNIDFEVSESPPFNGHDAAVETLSFLWQHEGIHLTIYAVDDLRNHVRKPSSGKSERANIDALRAQLAQQADPESDLT